MVEVLLEKDSGFDLGLTLINNLSFLLLLKMLSFDSGRLVLDCVCIIPKEHRTVCLLMYIGHFLITFEGFMVILNMSSAMEDIVT